MWSTLELAVPWSTDFDDEELGGFTYPIFDKVEKGDRPTISKGFKAPPGFVSLMRKCWSQNPSDRPSFNEITPVLRNMRNVLHVTNLKNRTTESFKSFRRHSMPSTATLSSGASLETKTTDGPMNNSGLQMSHSSIESTSYSRNTTSSSSVYESRRGNVFSTDDTRRRQGLWNKTTSLDTSTKNTSVEIDVDMETI